MLTNEKWKCSQCKKEKPYWEFFLQGEIKANTEAWDAKYEKSICRPGALRLCLGCAPETETVATPVEEKPTHPCYVCGLQQLAEAYSESMWHNKANHSRTTVCRSCCQPKTHPCDGCGLQQPQGEYTESMWNNKAKTTRGTLCNTCLLPKHPCDLCGLQKPQGEYSKSMWHNKEQASRRTLCNDCCRPRCTRTSCKTCRTCRNAGEGGAKVCRRRHCTESIEGLNSKQLPETIEQRNQWLCLQCRTLVCQVCKKQLSQSIQRSRKSSGAQTFKPCGDCQNLAESKRVRQKYT